MKKYLIIITIIFSTTVNYAQDQVSAMLDSLTTVYFFKDIQIKNTDTRFIESKELRDKVYYERIKQLAHNSPFNYTYNSIVEQYINNYVKKPKSVSTILALSDLYFPLYEKYLTQYNIPLELKYLSVVESALNPTAKSHCGAAGLWQFMYYTGKSYSLNITSYIDERYDPELETIAACKYLKHLFDVYNDWSLAIAAYNCGEGNVNKALRKSEKKDFWSIKPYLPKETQNYVPAFIAASYIMTYYKEHNMEHASIKFLYNDLDYVIIDQKITLKEISLKLKMSKSELSYLNPKYYLGVIPGSSDKLILPKEKALEWIELQNPTIPRNLPKPEQPKVIISNREKTELPKTNVLQSKPNPVSYNCIIYGDQKINDGGILLLRNMEQFSFNEITIPKNSIIKAKVTINNTIVNIKTVSATTIDGEIILNLKGLIHQSTSKKQISFNDGFLLTLKS